MHSHIPSDFSVFQIIALIVGFSLLKATAANLDELEEMLAQGLISALHSAHVSFQEAAFAMGTNERQFRKQLAREDHHQLSLYKLLKLPFSVWLFFGPALIAVVYRKRLQEFAQSVEDMKRSA